VVEGSLCGFGDASGRGSLFWFGDAGKEECSDGDGRQAEDHFSVSIHGLQLPLDWDMTLALKSFQIFPVKKLQANFGVQSPG
jgi:hypothetical protein